MEDKYLESLVSKKQVKTAVENMTGKDDPEIVDIRVKRSSKGVEGLVSTVLRVKVGYRCEVGGAVHTKNYVIKRLPETESQLEIVRKTGIFEKESCYFRTVQNFCRRLAEGRVTLPMPESDYSISNGTDDAIFLDDLTISGYRTADRKFRIAGMDLPHCEVAMELLGRLHGLAAASQRLLPEGGWESLGPPLFREICFYERSEGENPSLIVGTLENTMKTVVELSKQIEGLPMEAAESGELERLLEGTWKMMCKLVCPKGYNVPKVLCHGDFWVNNIMFKYDETGKKPVDAKAVDFQVTRCSHPCTDILHFLNCCMKKSLRDQHMDHLLEVYHKSMADTMELVHMGPPLISLQRLKQDAYREYKVYGAVIGCLWRPQFMIDELFCADREKEFDTAKLDEMLKSGSSAAVRTRFAEDEIFRKEMTDLVREVVDAALPKGLEDLGCSPFRA